MFGYTMTTMLREKPSWPAGKTGAAQRHTELADM